MSRTNYNAASNRNPTQTKPTTPVAEEPVAAKTVEELVYGTVANCERLNIRKNPDLTASIICDIGKGTKVLVDAEGSTVEWYKVDVGGQIGFCMKKYMTIDR